MNKMNARETFEKLGYKRLENRVDPTYCKKDDPWTWINFCNNGVAISTQHGLGYKFLSYELLKAIYEQMEELESLKEK